METHNRAPSLGGRNLLERSGHALPTGIGKFEYVVGGIDGPDLASRAGGDLFHLSLQADPLGVRISVDFTAGANADHGAIAGSGDLSERDHFIRRLGE